MTLRTKLLWLLLLALVAFAVAKEYRELFVTPAGDPNASAIVFIRPNSSVKRIAAQLRDAGVIGSPLRFRIVAKLRRLERKLKPGEYRFARPSSPWDALGILVEGKVILHRVTMPEGITMVDTAHILSSAELVRLDSFLALLSDAELLKKTRVPAPSFEGFLFPDTYYFSKVDEPAKMIRTMTDRFHAALRPEDRKRAEALGFSLVQWVTLASIIEKESSLPAEHAIVSAVFHNRLKKKMRLQSDPTVIYGLAKFDGNLRKTDLQTPTPYNTYTRAGLPPGPIANPGASALSAAVNPTAVDYLYFVARKDGTHVFAKTYEEHLKNVATFQLRR
jgi:UPF0755 protein